MLALALSSPTGDFFFNWKTATTNVNPTYSNTTKPPEV
jgi:hypothetical protein